MTTLMLKLIKEFKFCKSSFVFQQYAKYVNIMKSNAVTRSPICGVNLFSNIGIIIDQINCHVCTQSFHSFH